MLASPGPCSSCERLMQSLQQVDHSYVGLWVDKLMRNTELLMLLLVQQIQWYRVAFALSSCINFILDNQTSEISYMRLTGWGCREKLISKVLLHTNSLCVIINHEGIHISWVRFSLFFMARIGNALCQCTSNLDVPANHVQTEKWVTHIR